MNTHIAIIGAGAAGLFAAVEMVRAGWTVDLYDRKSQCGIKFLLAGQSGLNITNSESIDTFALRYGTHAEFFRALLADFSPGALRGWLSDLGIATFTGSSGKIFPEGMQADGIVRAILGYLENSGAYTFHPGYRFAGFDSDKKVMIERVSETGEAGSSSVLEAPVLLALGGASYPETGSDGSWMEIFRQNRIPVESFRPANCGFECPWSEKMKGAGLPLPLKNAALHFGGMHSRGDLMLSAYGIEGSPVYTLSREIRDAIEQNGKAEITIDLFPDLDIEALGKRLARKQGKMTSSNFLRKTLSLTSAQMNMFLESFGPDGLKRVIEGNANLLKTVTLQLTSPRPIAEAISSSGGVCFSALDDRLMLKDFPGVYCAGEMLDWDAPTGGYLLQGCFATAHRVCSAIS